MVTFAALSVISLTIAIVDDTEDLVLFMAVIGIIGIGVFLKGITGCMRYHARDENNYQAMKAVVYISLIMIAIGGIGMFAGYYMDNGSNSSSTSSRTCPVCGRSFSEGSSDYSNIGYAGMCDNCERNYHLANGD